MANYPSYFWGGSGEVLHIVKDWDGKALCGKEEKLWHDPAGEDWLNPELRACKTCSEEPSGRSGLRNEWRMKSLQEAMLALWGRGC